MGVHSSDDASACSSAQIGKTLRYLPTSRAPFLEVLPTKFQFAFQGGGARIAALLAAADAIEELESQGEILVTNIAGTSAGAIVGACLAAKRPIGNIRAQLHGQNGDRMLRAFRKPTLISSAWKMYMGNPFWNDGVLRSWLAEQFKDLRKEGPPRMKDVAPKQLFVVAANLSTGEAKKYSGDEDLVTALLDSSGLPFCFRPWKSGNHPVVVDGGLCDNLPIDDLIGRTSTDGRVLAFSFRRTSPGNPSSGLGFAMGLIDVAINRSVQVARERLGAGAVFTLDTSITTFDFKAARSFLGSDEYDNTKDEVKKWIRSLIAASKPIPKKQSTKDYWWKDKSEDHYEAMGVVGRLYEAYHAKQKFLLHSLKFVVTCNCLAAAGQAGYNDVDDVFYELVFSANDSPVFAHRLSLSTPCENVLNGNYSITVYDSENRAVPFEILPSIAPNSPGERDLIVYFTQPLLPKMGRYRICLRDAGSDLMSGLKNAGGEDGLCAMLSRAFGAIDSVSFGIHVPGSFRPLSLKRSNIENIRTIQDGEADRVFGAPPLGFVTFGVVAANVLNTPYLETFFQS